MFTVFDFLVYPYTQPGKILCQTASLALTRVSSTMFYYQSFRYCLVVHKLESVYNFDGSVNYVRFFNRVGIYPNHDSIINFRFQKATIVETKNLSTLRSDSAFVGAKFCSIPLLRVAFFDGSSGKRQQVGPLCNYMLNPLKTP